jgi:hypothetical protein
VAFKLAEAGAKVAVNYCNMPPKPAKRVARMQSGGNTEWRPWRFKADMGVEPEIISDAQTDLAGV